MLSWRRRRVISTIQRPKAVGEPTRINGDVSHGAPSSQAVAQWWSGGKSRGDVTCSLGWAGFNLPCNWVGLLQNKKKRMRVWVRVIAVAQTLAAVQCWIFPPSTGEGSLKKSIIGCATYVYTHASFHVCPGLSAPSLGALCSVSPLYADRYIHIRNLKLFQ